MDLFWIMLGFFLFVTLAFVVLAFAFPEWFGITGKKALEIQKHQRDPLSTEDSKADTPKNN